MLSESWKTIPWACPSCRSAIGTDLVCGCGHNGYQLNGMIYLHRNDESWEQCMVERNGWIGRTKEVGLYRENPDHFYLPDRLPHLKEFYAESKAHIDAFAKHENLKGKVCLDIGASIGWVEAYLMETYPETTFIALEVNDDDLCGLGRSNAIKQKSGFDFVSLVADMHHMPLQDNSIDVVFSIDALHHFRDMSTVFAEVHRVLKSAGTFYGVNEPDRPDDTVEADYIKEYAEIELRHNIIERRPTLREYSQAGALLNVRAINDEVGLIHRVDTAGLLLKGQKPR